MPINKVPGGYKWGKSGKVYPTRKGAEKQAQAAYASGYTGMSEGGLWDNIHAKRKRIAAGSGEKMRAKGAPGAPTEEAMKKSSMKKGYMGGGMAEAKTAGYMGGGMPETKPVGYTGGGMAKKKGYAPGGLVQANCGASMKPNRTARK